MAPVWARRSDDGWLLTVRAQPGAARSEVAGPYGDALRIRIAAPADGGKANAELVRFVAAQLGVARRDVTVVRGHASRDKLLGVAGPEVEVSALVGDEPRRRSR